MAPSFHTPSFSPQNTRRLSSWAEKKKVPEKCISGWRNFTFPEHFQRNPLKPAPLTLQPGSSCVSLRTSAPPETKVSHFLQTQVSWCPLSPSPAARDRSQFSESGADAMDPGFSPPRPISPGGEGRGVGVSGGLAPKHPGKQVFWKLPGWMGPCQAAVKLSGSRLAPSTPRI